MKLAIGLFVGAVSLSLLAGCASNEHMGKLENRVGQLENQVRVLETRAVSSRNSNTATDRNNDEGYYCYMNGVRYTEGAIAGSQRCQRTGMLVGGDPKLQWRPNN